MIQIHEDVPKILIDPGVILIPEPERVFIELDPFLIHPTEDHSAQAPVSDRQSLLLPVLGGLVIPKFIRPQRDG